MSLLMTKHQQRALTSKDNTNTMTRMTPIREENTLPMDGEFEKIHYRRNDDTGAFPSKRGGFFSILEETKLPSLASISGNSTSVTSSEDDTTFETAREQLPGEEELEQLPTAPPHQTVDYSCSHRPREPLHPVPTAVVEKREVQEGEEDPSVDLVASLKALAKHKPEIPELILLEGAGNHAELETLISKLTLPEELLKVKRNGWLEDAAVPENTSDLTDKSSSSSSEEEEEDDRVRGMLLFVQIGRATHKGWYSGRVNANRQAHGNGIIKFDEDEGEEPEDMIMYMGEFDKGHMHGQGTLVLKGDILRGEFEYNLYVV